MFKKNRIKNLIILMFPSYLCLIFIILSMVFSMSISTIGWQSMLLFVICNFISAWMLSFKHNKLVNFLGTSFFFYLGWNNVASLVNPPKYNYSLVPWEVDFLIGLTLFFVGVVAFIYAIKSHEPSRVNQ